MAIYIDEPLWPAHGTRWSHLVSDTSLTELHDFAGAAGIPARAFDGDHYDVPAGKLTDLTAAGAERVGTRSMVRILMASGLRAIRPRSAKPHYKSRERALAAAVLTPNVEAFPQAPAGYDAIYGARTIGDAVARARELEPAVDAIIVVPNARADAGEDSRADAGRDARADAGAVAALLRAVYLDSAAIDGRSRFRHGAGPWVLGRVHWAALAGGLPDDGTATTDEWLEDGRGRQSQGEHARRRNPRQHDPAGAAVETRRDHR